jgi:diguanylate cyclase (GGDEF)-like protein
MDEHLPAKILLLAADRASARRWADILQGLDAHVWLDRAEMPPDEQPDVVVTDRRGDFQSPSAIGRVENSPCVGVVRMGENAPSAAGPAEVCLTADATVGELKLACRLLAQIVRLQRQQQAGAEQHRRLVEEALTDPLSGLPNRRAWDPELADRLARIRKADFQSPDAPRRVDFQSTADARRVENSPYSTISPATTTAPASPMLCLAILDLDLFKRINDARGHAAGDAVLRACGAALRGGLRQDDFVARLGGDEFGLLLWVRDAAAAAATVERVRAALPERLPAASLDPVTASAGYCVTPEPLASSSPVPCPAALFAAADEALRAAKQAGRNQTRGVT